MPMRSRDLFDRIASFEALHAAALRAARAKRGKPGVAAFLANLEREVLRLERELKSGSYRPGRYTKIEIFDPKHRIVSAAPFRDRVVHHAFCGVCEPIFERGFIHDSYANRVGKGTHRAVARYEKFRDRSRYVLRCDIFRYFHTIDHEILKRDLRRRLACERTLDLLRAKGYLRYVDDFVLFHDDREQLEEWRRRLARFLERRRLRLHPRKTMIQPTTEPVRFLGFVLLPGGRRRLPEDNVRRFRNRLRGLRDRWRHGTVAEDEVRRRVQSWIAHAEHADTRPPDSARWCGRHHPGPEADGLWRELPVHP